MFCATFAYAQQGTVKGKVVDDDGVPIAGASVMQKGTTNGGYTDVDGNYEISVNNMKSGVLQFTFVGFNTVGTVGKCREFLNKLIDNVMEFSYI